MDAFIEFVQANWMGLVAVGVCLLPFMYFTRKYSVPVLLFAVEFVIYTCLLHIVLHGVVRVTAWFKFESQMKMLEQDKVAVSWWIPVKRFWDFDLYNPYWLPYVEMALLAGALVLMIRYRPMRVQKPRAQREKLTKGVAPSSAKGGQAKSSKRKGRR